MYCSIAVSVSSVSATIIVGLAGGNPQKFISAGSQPLELQGLPRFRNVGSDWPDCRFPVGRTCSVPPIIQRGTQPSFGRPHMAQTLPNWMESCIAKRPKRCKTYRVAVLCCLIRSRSSRAFVDPPLRTSSLINNHLAPLLPFCSCPVLAARISPLPNSPRDPRHRSSRLPICGDG